MSHIIIVSFKEETKAIDALHKIKELDDYGDITLYEDMMIRKKENNQYQVLNDETEGEGWRTFTGMALGGLIGAIAGPVGLIIGLYSGTLVGAIFDGSHFNFEKNFIQKVSNKMEIGEIVIIAEVNEDSDIFIDNAMKPFSSEIIRSEAEIEYDIYVDEHIEDLEDKIEDEREKIKKATKEEKVKINTKIANLKAKRNAKIAELEAKRKSTLEEIKNKTKVRINKLEASLKGYEDSISDSITKAKVNRIQKKINKQKSKLSKLNKLLEEVLL
ncbi:Uncharacterized membrane protein [Polaribacter sp. KT25b]|uniref:DUF1269 domain-containing protein n=1 Tax=Polaribacter sp. KT25b TaxID=1855336 RepID=UPI00087DCC26|nr:DUF1269 domain-containing protein [Polaribacter sp. KT25b]SDS24638.1 Uncharacterized membrane protein [Polaribacter sp. KT25b]